MEIDSDSYTEESYSEDSETSITESESKGDRAIAPVDEVEHLNNEKHKIGRRNARDGIKRTVRKQALKVKSQRAKICITM